MSTQFLSILETVRAFPSAVRGRGIATAETTGHFLHSFLEPVHMYQSTFLLSNTILLASSIDIWIYTVHKEGSVHASICKYTYIVAEYGYPWDGSIIKILSERQYWLLSILELSRIINPPGQMNMCRLPYVCINYYYYTASGNQPT